MFRSIISNSWVKFSRENPPKNFIHIFFAKTFRFGLVYTELDGFHKFKFVVRSLELIKLKRNRGSLERFRS